MHAGPTLQREGSGQRPHPRDTRDGNPGWKVPVVQDQLTMFPFGEMRTSLRFVWQTVQKENIEAGDTPTMHRTHENHREASRHWLSKKCNGSSVHLEQLSDCSISAGEHRVRNSAVYRGLRTLLPATIHHNMSHWMSDQPRYQEDTVSSAAAHHEHAVVVQVAVFRHVCWQWPQFPCQWHQSRWPLGQAEPGSRIWSPTSVLCHLSNGWWILYHVSAPYIRCQHKDDAVTGLMQAQSV